VSTRPGDGALGRVDAVKDEHLRRWDVVTPSATVIGHPRDPSQDVDENLRQLHEEAHLAMAGHSERMHRLEKARITHAFCNTLSLTPWERDRALGIMVELDLTAFGSRRAIPTVALVVIRHVVDDQRQRRLGLHDEAWLGEQPPDALESLYDAFDSLTDSDDYRELLAGYYGVISHVDDAVGRILDALDEQGLREETVVIFTADHGDHAGQFGWFFKGTMYEGAARVPLVVADPTAGGPSGRTSERVVNNLDLFETVLERAGVDCGYDTASRSLCGLLDDPATAEWSDVAYAELGNERMLADDEYKLIRREEDGDELYELYDRGERPYDAENRWGRPGYREKQRELVERLDAHAASLADNGPA
jgi:hypothetical protein